MPYIYVKDFSQGLDNRRMDVTTAGGALLELTDAHINRGGEIEGRKAFVPLYSLPPGTIGMAASPLSLYVFGSGAMPAGIPAGVLYQRLQHPDGVTSLVRVLSTDLFGGKLYVVGLFADASIQHFFDGARVANWFDGRAKASFVVTGGSAGGAARGAFRVVSGTTGVGNALADLTVDGVSIIDNPVPYDTNDVTTAQAIVDEINTSAAGFVALRDVDLVVIEAPAPGAGVNGDVVLPTVTGVFVVGEIGNMAGGVDPGVVSGITVDSVSIMGSAVPWDTSNETTAADIAAEISATTSSPDYGAVAIGAQVIITATVDGTAANGKAVAVTADGDITVDPTSGIAMAGGSDPASGSDAQPAKATFRVTAGGPQVDATGSFRVDSGNDPETLATLTVNGVSIISGALHFAADQTSDEVAAAIAADITAFASTPNFTATSAGDKILITAAGAGASGNGTLAATGDLESIFEIVNLSGGSDAGRLLGLTVNGVAVIGGLIEWAGSNNGMAIAIADAINGFTSSPEYTAGAVDNAVTISAAVAGAASNGLAVAFNRGPTLGIDPAAGLVLSGGADDVPGTFQPGSYVRTIKSKVYSTSGSNLHFSGIDAPTQWETDTVGAGFINMAKQASGSEQLQAIVTYQRNAAIFAPRTIQVWYLDVDPDLSQQVQVLSNTGTSAPLSVTAFGDQDVFYLDESGVRSLQARNSSNAAFASDIGNPIDTLVQTVRREAGAAWRDRAIGLIEPLDGRFWLILRSTIFVFSYFTNSKISAWSMYRPGVDVDYATVFDNRVYIRSGDVISCYGGLSGSQYDATRPRVRLPFLDAGDPGTPKRIVGLDAACRGTWDVEMSLNPNQPIAVDLVATIFETTFTEEKIGTVGESTHVGLTFTGRGDAAPPLLGSVLIHYMKGIQEANG